jgi:phosphoribosylaminoimidazolecarboxamide formyltransferase/IMP cyclohydrolase
VAPEVVPTVPVARALLSLSDKSGLVEFAQGLESLGVELWATRGTRTALEAGGTHPRAAEDLTGIGSWFGGRIKTLHPGLLAGILSPSSPQGEAELKERGFLRFDLVAVQLYPFEQYTATHPEATDREEYIDIGGVTLARAAAKNHERVAVIIDPTQYAPILQEMRRLGGGLSNETRRRLAVEAFERCASYDRAIALGLQAKPTETGDPFPDQVTFRRLALKLRYGENPHQRAATYATDQIPGSPPNGDPFDLLKGAALSFTNLLDLNAAVTMVSEFPTPTAAVVKHAAPCGVASGTTLREAIEQAIATDPIARYGCTIAVNRPIGPEDPSTLHGVFVDLLGAPSVDEEARRALDRRPKLKIVRIAPPASDAPRWEAHAALGRLLLQEADRRQLAPGDFRLVTGPAVSPEAACSLDFAWRVVRHVKSNGIVLAQGSKTVGIGGGQPTRATAVHLACEVAGARAQGAVLASDAFFPFADGVEIAGKAGVRAIIQPGGSVRDPEVIAMAERYGITMYFTGWRVFRH